MKKLSILTLLMIIEISTSSELFATTARTPKGNQEATLKAQLQDRNVTRTVTKSNGSVTVSATGAHGSRTATTSATGRTTSASNTAGNINRTSSTNNTGHTSSLTNTNSDGDVVGYRYVYQDINEYGHNRDVNSLTSQGGARVVSDNTNTGHEADTWTSQGGFRYVTDGGPSEINSGHHASNYNTENSLTIDYNHQYPSGYVLYDDQQVTKSQAQSAIAANQGS